MAAVHLLFLLSLLFPASLAQQSTSAPALIKFKNSLTKSDSLTNWKDDGSNPCAPNKVWVGVVCSAGKITTVNLANMGLEGKPDVGALEALGSLRAISLENNALTGPIPEFNRLRSLKAIYASKNRFSGEIPSDFFQTLGTLKKLWLSNNNFSGPIPKAIGELSNLKELRLEHNEFSGPIPEFQEVDGLNVVNLSNNKLEGRIPDKLSHFDAKYFENNEGLCGPKLANKCPAASAEAEPAAPPKPESKSSTKWIIMGVVVALLILTILIKAKKKEENVRILGKESLDEAVVNIPTAAPRRSASKKGQSSVKKNEESGSTRSSRRGGSQGGRSVGDLVMVNDERGVFGLQDLMKAAAEVLGNGGLGSAYKAMLGTGVSVVVKRVREMNKMSKDEFDGEMRRLAKLQHQNILTPLAYHFRKEEKLVVSEYVPKGSLLYVLHGDRGICHAELNWQNRLKIIQGVARGMGFLHSEFSHYELPHGNLKSSNVLLGANYEPLLSDYALHPLINDTPTVQSMFAFKTPEALLYQKVCHKSDVYCLGIIILETVTGKYPSQYLNNQKGGTDVVQWVRSALDENRETELIDPEISSGQKEAIAQMGNLLHIGAACTESELDQRIDMKEAIRRIEELVRHARIEAPKDVISTEMTRLAIELIVPK